MVPNRPVSQHPGDRDDLDPDKSSDPEIYRDADEAPGKPFALVGLAYMTVLILALLAIAAWIYWG